MKRTLPFLAALLALVPAALQAAPTLNYRGTIAGKYSIEMELTNQDDKSFTGRYRYQGKTQWMTLKGQLGGATQSRLQLQEFAPDGKNTGSFDIAFEGESLVGSWQKVPPAGKLDVKLMLFDSGSASSGGSAQPAASGLTGKFGLEINVDTSSFPADHKNETPTGDLTVAQEASGDLKFDLDYNTGYPNYHIAQVGGVAKAAGAGKFRHAETSTYTPPEKCVLEFSVEGRNLRLDASTGPACGFGANADPSGLYRRK